MIKKSFVILIISSILINGCISMENVEHTDKRKGVVTYYLKNPWHNWVALDGGRGAVEYIKDHTRVPSNADRKQEVNYAGYKKLFEDQTCKINNYLAFDCERMVDYSYYKYEYVYKLPFNLNDMFDGEDK